MLDAVDAAELLPGILPVGPAVRHADALELALTAGGFFEIRDVLGGKQRLTDGPSGASALAITLFIIPSLW